MNNLKNWLHLNLMPRNMENFVERRKLVKRAILFLLHIPLVIFLLVEYFMFMWFWSGDGEFAFFGCGISFIIYLLLHIFAYFKVNEKLKKVIIYSAIILTPILSVITIYLILAPLLGVSIQIA